MTPPVNVLYALHSLGLGGAQKYALSLIQNLDKDRFRPFLVYDQPGPLEDDFRRAGAQLERLAGPYRLRDPRSLRRMFQVMGLVRRENIALAHVQSPVYLFYGVLPARLAGCRVIVSTHGYGFSRLERFLIRALTPLSDVVLEGAQFTLDELARVGCDPARFRLIPYGVEAPPNDPGARARVRAAWGIPPNAFVVCRLATFRPYKGMTLFLDAAEKLLESGVPAYFLAVGDGEEMAALKARAGAGRLAGRVVFTGLQKDPSPFFTASDVVAHTSLFDEVGMANLQALAAGKPIVGTRYGPAIEDVIHDGVTGRLTPPEPGALAAALKEIYEQPARRAAMEEASRRLFAERFDIRAAAAATQDLYRDVLDARGRR